MTSTTRDLAPERTVVETILIVVAVVALNVIVYVLPIDYGAFGHYAYAGVFLITLIASGAFVLPIPYLPIVAKVAAVVGPAWVVVLVAALGSVIGDSTGWYVGRIGRRFVPEGTVVRWIRRVASHPPLAALTLCALAVPPNPAFDVAGLAAGAMRVSYRLFFVSVLAGRIVHFALVALVGLGLEAFWSSL